MSKFRSALLIEAKRRFEEEKKQQGLLAVVSPSPTDLIEVICSDLHFSSAVIIELGCGDGRWLKQLSSRRGVVHCVGIEVNKSRLERAQSLCDQQNNIDLIQGDFSLLHLSIFNVVIMYLSIEGNEFMRNKIERECASGTLVISIGFRIRDWNALKEYHGDSDICLKAYKYVLHRES